jgi:hypothetical protein
MTVTLPRTSAQAVTTLPGPCGPRRADTTD